MSEREHETVRAALKPDEQLLRDVAGMALSREKQSEHPHPADWATAVATEVLAGLHRFTVTEATQLLEVALRDARSKGYAECLTANKVRPTMADLARMQTPEHIAYVREYGVAAAQRQHQHRMAVRHALSMPLDDTQADHDDTVLAGHPGFAGVGA